MGSFWRYSKAPIENGQRKVLHPSPKIMQFTQTDWSGYSGDHQLAHSWRADYSLNSTSGTLYRSRIGQTATGVEPIRQKIGLKTVSSS